MFWFHTGWEWLDNPAGFFTYVVFMSLVGGPLMWLFFRNKDWLD